MSAKELITVDEAKKIIFSHSIQPSAVLKPLGEAAGLVLREPAISPSDVPAFAQSSMDGYAIRFEEAGQELNVQGTMAAGAQRQVTLGTGQAMRIFTGGPLPEGADTIVVQENALRSGDKVSFTEAPARKGLFVRTAGTELRKGDEILPAGTALTPVLIGLLAGSGIQMVHVTPPPVVTVMATGPEFAPAGTALAFGQVYESNGIFLQAAITAAGIRKINQVNADDTLIAVKTSLQDALETSDVVILTGGVSVGDFDFVRRAADESDVVCHFHKVKQKPGKPIYFGTRDGKLVFGLPGNPGSVVTCFYEYVLPALQITLGQTPGDGYANAVLAEDFVKVKGLTQFLKGFENQSGVSVLGGQESFRLRSFSQSNCLVRLEAEKEEYKKGENVRIRRLPA